MVYQLNSKNLQKQNQHLQELDFSDAAFQAEYANDKDAREQFYTELLTALEGREEEVSKADADFYFYLLKRGAQDGNKDRIVKFERDIEIPGQFDTVTDEDGNEQKIAKTRTDYLWPTGADLASSFSRHFKPLFIDNPIDTEADNAAAKAKKNMNAQRTYAFENAAVFGPSYLKTSIGDAPEIPELNGEQDQSKVFLPAPSLRHPTIVSDATPRRATEEEIAQIAENFAKSDLGKALEQSGEQAGEQAAEQTEDAAQETPKAAETGLDQEQEAALAAALEKDLADFVASQQALTTRQQTQGEALQKMVEEARAKSDAAQAVLDEVSGDRDFKTFKQAFEDHYNKENLFIGANSEFETADGVFPDTTLARLYKNKKAQGFGDALTNYTDELDRFIGTLNHLENTKKGGKERSAFVTDWFNKALFEDKVQANADSENAKKAGQLFDDITAAANKKAPELSTIAYYHVLRNTEIANDDARKARFNEILDDYAAAKEGENFDLNAFLLKTHNDNEESAFQRFKAAITQAYGEGRHAESLKDEENLRSLHDNLAGFVASGVPFHGEALTSRIETAKKYGLEDDASGELKSAINHLSDQRKFNTLLNDGYTGEHKNLVSPLSSSAMFNDLIDTRLKRKGIEASNESYDQTGEQILGTLDKIKEKRGEASLNNFLTKKFDKLVAENTPEEPKKGQKIKPVAYLQDKAGGIANSGFGRFIKANWIGLAGAAVAGWSARAILDGFGPQLLGETTMGALTAQATALAGTYAPLALEMATGGVLGAVSGAVGNTVFQCWKGYAIARDKATEGTPELKGQYWKLALTEPSVRADIGRSIKENFSFKSLLIGTAAGSIFGAGFAFLAHYADSIVEGAKNAWTSIFGGGAATPGGDTIVPPAGDGVVTPGDGAVVPPSDGTPVAPACDPAITTVPSAIDTALKQQIMDAMNADGRLTQVERGIAWRLEHGSLAQQIQAAKDFTQNPSGGALRIEILNALDEKYGHLLYHSGANTDPQLVRALTQVNADSGYYNLRELMNGGVVDGDPKLIDALRDVAEAADKGNTSAAQMLAQAQTRYPEALAAAVQQNADAARSVAECVAGGTVTPAPVDAERVVVPPVDADRVVPPADTARVTPDLCDPANPTGAAERATERVAEVRPEVRPAARPVVTPDLCDPATAATGACVMPDNVEPAHRTEFAGAVSGATVINTTGFTPVATTDAAYNQLVQQANAYAFAEQATGNHDFSRYGAIERVGDSFYHIARAGTDQFAFTKIGDGGVASQFVLQNGGNINRVVGFTGQPILMADLTARVARPATP